MLSISVGSGHVASRRPARLGQQRADDVLLLRRRPRGAARVRPRRAARAPPRHAAAARRGRRDGGRRWRSTSRSTPGAPSAHGWGIAMSTDTAFALGMLALVGPRFPDRLRAFMLDRRRRRRHRRAARDRDRLLGIRSRRAASSSRSRSSAWSSAAARLARPRAASSTSLLGAAAWVALLKSGVDPVVVGLAMGLLTYASPAPRATTSSARPTCSARSASSRRPSSPARRALGSGAAISPNERLQQLFHPWTSYVIVPLFALANAGIAINGSFLVTRATARRSRSASSSATCSASRLGIVGDAWLVTQADARPAAAAGRLGRRRRRRHDRRHRLHRLAADRDARASTARSSRRRSSASSPRRSARRC